MKRLVVLAIVAALALNVSLVLAQCLPLPDFDLSVAYFRDSANHDYPLSVMMVPDGSGDALAEVRRPDASQVNGQIVVFLLDAVGVGAAGIAPAEIRVDVSDDQLAFCPEGNIAGVATDSEGYTYFSAPWQGGGWSTDDLRVYVCNVPLASAYLPLWVNSPDIDGDLEVNLSDVQLFSVDFFGAYAYRSDLAYDGVINLSDLSRLAQHLGAGCP